MEVSHGGRRVLEPPRRLLPQLPLFCPQPAHRRLHV